MSPHRPHDVTVRARRRVARSRSAVLGRLQHLGLAHGVPVPAERIESVAQWIESAGDGAELTILPAGEPRRAHGGRTLGTPVPELAVRGASTPSPVWVLRLANGRLATDSGLVVTPDGRVLAETAWDRFQLESSLAARRRLPKPVRIGGMNVSLVSLWSENFFHWMLDALPRYGVLQQADVERGAGIVVPEHLSAFQSESLELLGIDRRRRIPYRREHIQADVLVWPSPAGHTGNPTPWSVGWLRERLRPAAAAEEPHRRLYVTRAFAKRRRIANEDEVWRMLASHGFERVHPEHLTLREQIALFSEAAVVVGPHGAAHTNVLFSPRLSLVEVLDPSYVNACNLMLAEAAGHAYWYVVGQTVNDGDIDVPLDLLEATVRAAAG